MLTNEQTKALKIDIDTSEKLLKGAEAAGAVTLGGLCNLWILPEIGPFAYGWNLALCIGFWAIIGAGIVGGIGLAVKANSWNYDQALDNLADNMNRPF